MAVTPYTPNFETIRRAFEHGDVVLLEAREKATNETVALLCAVNFIDGEYEFVPLAKMINGNPYEQFDPPDPDGGFVTE